MELLEHHADLVPAVARQFLGARIGQHVAVEDDLAARRAVHTADDIHER